MAGMMRRMRWCVGQRSAPLGSLPPIPDSFRNVAIDTYRLKKKQTATIRSTRLVAAQRAPPLWKPMNIFSFARPRLVSNGGRNSWRRLSASYLAFTLLRR
jgi:hypothetical protein